MSDNNQHESLRSNVYVTCSRQIQRSRNRTLDSSGRLGWRRGWDPNPRSSCPLNRLAGGYHRPLGHPSNLAPYYHTRRKLRRGRSSPRSLSLSQRRCGERSVVASPPAPQMRLPIAQAIVETLPRRLPNTTTDSSQVFGAPSLRASRRRGGCVFRNDRKPRRPQRLHGRRPCLDPRLPSIDSPATHGTRRTSPH